MKFGTWLIIKLNKNKFYKYEKYTFKNYLYYLYGFFSHEFNNTIFTKMVEPGKSHHKAYFTILIFFITFS